MDDVNVAMNTLQGSFYSTAFQVRDEQAFAADSAILETQKYMDMFAGERDGVLTPALN